MAVCEAYWQADGKVSGNDVVEAERVLWERGQEILAWCRDLLRRADYVPRETGAGLLGSLGARGQLGEDLDAVVAELGQAVRYVDPDEPKSAQAADAAFQALIDIGTRPSLAQVRAVLMADVADELADDLEEVITTLQTLTGENFLEADDALEAARAWLLAHGETE